MLPASSHVRGLDATVQKRSEVGARGDLRVEPIDGLRFRLTRPVAHEDGHLIEIARNTWDLLDHPIVQVHMTTTFVRVVCYDGRTDSPTCGRINEFSFSDRNPGLLAIPPNVYHGWKNIGVTESIVLNMPTSVYDYDRPDSFDLPWDTQAARELIPYTW